MNRFQSSIALLSFCAALIGCGAPPADGTRGPGGTEMMGPDTDGRFYVVGFEGDVAPFESVTVTNIEGASVEVTADETGSWAAMLWSEITAPVSIESSTAMVQSAASSPQKINANYASRRGLESLPGIGESLANAIINHRQIYGLFETPGDLVNVSGIGSVSIQQFIEHVETKLDVNSVTKTQLMVLPEIGAARASAIVAHREAYGPFSQPSDLMLVKGITASIYSAIEPYVVAGEIETHPGATLVNVNVANIEALRTLPGIGAAKAKAITDYRQNHGAFNTKEDLIFVPGIGSVTLAAIRDLVTVGVLDPKVGTFVVDGSWQYETGHDVYGGSFPEPLLVKFDHSVGSELLVTFVGGGFCADLESCAPFTLKGVVAQDHANGDFTYRLSGLIPADDGNFVVTASSETEGWVTETDILTSLVATRDGETYRMALTGHRVIN